MRRSVVPFLPAVLTTILFLVGSAPASASCGDGIVDPGEQCDDGNLFDGDDCRSTCQLPLAGVDDFASDDFSTCPAEPVPWSVHDPGGVGTVARIAPASGEAVLELSVPAGATYDAWPSSGTSPVNGALFVSQPALDADLEIEAGFGSEPQGGFNDLGIVVEGGAPGCSAATSAACDWLRFDVYRTGASLWAFAGASIGGKNWLKINAAIPVGSGHFLRVTRAADEWTLWHSADGSSWSQAAAPFAQALTVGAVGVYAANVTSANGYTAQVDYLFNVADPIVPEDGGGFDCDDGLICTSDACPFDPFDVLWACENLANDEPGCACGDGALDPDGAEQCDDGEANSDDLADACRTDCTLPGCGDGVIDSGETCDDGAANSDETPDVCRTDCAVAYCGDGVIDSGETCDDGVANSDVTPNACRTDCTPAGCGDGILDTGESCDDGNRVDGDGCSYYCVYEQPFVQRVAFDFFPMTCPNFFTVNAQRGGKLPAAILGSAAFDVTTIDPDSIEVAGVRPFKVSFADVAAPYVPFVGKQTCFECNTEGPDGYLDLVLKFERRELADALEEVSSESCVVLQVTGALKEEFGGLAFEGEDVLMLHRTRNIVDIEF